MLVLGLGAGCDSVLGLHAITGTSDGASDAAGDGAGMTCLGAPPFDVCVATPTKPLLLEGTGSAGYDTSNPPSAMPCVSYTGLLGAKACVLAGTNVTVTNLGVIGDDSLVLFATGDLTISAQLDVASHAGVDHGPGADPGACVAGTAPAGTGAGGWGASFGGTGGHGGAPSGGMGGVPGTPSSVSGLRGGCPGGSGSGTSVHEPGAGGGAVLLVAGGMIRIDATVDASGAGGGGGDASSSIEVAGGGCGGGSGGLIVLEAAQIELGMNGALFANGGGGGQGGGSVAGADGGESTGPTLAASGGDSQGVAGGHGGAGATGSGSAATGADAPMVPLGAGGGGGAVGVIVLRAPMITGVVSSGTMANVSPAPTTVPPP